MHYIPLEDGSSILKAVFEFSASPRDVENDTK